MLLYENIIWQHIREKVWKQDFNNLTLEELFFIGNNNTEFTVYEVTLICNESKLDFNKARNKKLVQFNLQELRALLNTSLLNGNNYILEVQRSKDKFRDLLPYTVVRLTKEAQARYKERGEDFKDVTIQRLFRSDTSHTSYNLKDTNYMLMSYDIAKVIEEGYDW